MSIALDIAGEFLLCLKGSEIYKKIQELQYFSRNYERYWYLQQLDYDFKDIKGVCSVCQEQEVLFVCNTELIQCNKGCYTKVTEAIQEQKLKKIKKFLQDASE